jgi:hypothetical protein
MFRYKMTSNDKCPRCGEIESTMHLLWECDHVKHIWSLYNELVQSVGVQQDKILKYDDVYSATTSGVVNLVKIRVIQELIQIDRPRNWTRSHINKIVVDLINTKKYNATESHSIQKFSSRWGALVNHPSLNIPIYTQTR